MQFSYGATVFNANLHSLTSGRDGHNQIAEMNTKSWSPTLYDADGNVFFAGNNEAKYRMPGGVALNYCTSKMLEDGSFLRIGDITLAYALGKKVAKKVGMQNIKLFASVKNLCVFTKYTGFDPEVLIRAIVLILSVSILFSDLFNTLNIEFHEKIYHTIIGYYVPTRNFRFVLYQFLGREAGV